MILIDSGRVQRTTVARVGVDHTAGGDVQPAVRYHIGAKQRLTARVSDLEIVVTRGQARSTRRRMLTGSAIEIDVAFRGVLNIGIDDAPVHCRREYGPRAR